MSMREIGGYFELENFGGREYYPDLTAVNDARNALLYILKVRGYRKVYLPYYLCESVSAMCRREGYQYEFYMVGRDFLPRFDVIPGPNECLYIVNHYGQITKDTVANLSRRYQRIILDNVQAFFQKPIEGVDTLYSCRKFFGVPDGAYLSTEGKLELPQDISMDRMTHLLGRYEGASASLYFAASREHNRMFSELGLCAMSRLTHNLLGAIPYERVKMRREQNYQTLDKLLGTDNSIRLVSPEGPFAYPFYCRNGLEVKKGLAKRKVFVPTLWPNVLEREGTIEADLAANILPLPCDQRYDSEDMIVIADTLKAVLDEC